MNSSLRIVEKKQKVRGETNMSVSKYISTQFSSVLSGESCLGSCRLMGCWEWGVLWLSQLPQ